MGNHYKGTRDYVKPDLQHVQTPETKTEANKKYKKKSCGTAYLLPKKET